MQHNNIKVLNRDEIKYFAMAVMLLNHIADIFMKPGTLLAEIFMDVGYFTAITMCYFLVEGFQYTRSKKKYGIRLAVFAVISQFPFHYAFDNGGWSMMYTLFLCFLILVVRAYISNTALCAVLQIVLALASINSDWALFAPIFVILFDRYRLGKVSFWRAYIAGIIGMGLLKYMDYAMIFSAPKAILCAVGACLGVLSSGIVLHFLYNGKRAEHGRIFSKWFFYIFYPVHLMVLGIIAKF